MSMDSSQVGFALFLFFLTYIFHQARNKNKQTEKNIYKPRGHSRPGRPTLKTDTVMQPSLIHDR